MPLNNFRKSRVVVNGAVSASGTVSRAAGYVNWIGDYLRKNFQSVDTITKELNNTDMQLTYAVGGYSSKNYLTIMGEQSSPSATVGGILIPEEDYDIFLHKSQPIAKIVYSAVVVKKTNLGYSVSGYNNADPYFTVFPSQESNNNYSLSINGIAATIYKDYENFTVDIPYGTDFTSVQAVVDFLIGYQRYLESIGLLFTENSPIIKEPMNFVLSAKEFITWHQQGWKENDLIVLSPVADTLQVNLPNGTTDRIQNNKLYSRVLDQNYNVIDNKDTDINRYDNFTSIKCKNITTIGLVSLDVVEYEHQIVFKNKTQFNDIIYQPNLGNRQSRLKITGTKTDNWVGTLDAPGFVINLNTVDAWGTKQVYSTGDIVKYKEFYYVALETNTETTFNTNFWQQIEYNQINQTLLPNLATIANEGRNYYDINSVNLNETFDSHARGLIGYRERDYFNAMGLDTVSQTKFYQGFIKNKGTMPALKALKNVQFGKLSNAIEIYEDWAFRVGEYGNIDASQSIEISIQEQYFMVDPGVGVMANRLNANEIGVQLIKPTDFYKKPNNFTNDIFAEESLQYREDNIRSAGYVDINDVDTTIFDIQDLSSSNVLPDIYPSYTVWCALDYTRDWNVFRVADTGLMFKEVSALLDQQLMIEFKDIHLLSVGDVVAVKNFSALIDGFYRIESVPAIDTIVVSTKKSLRGFTSTTGSGLFYKLISLRYENIESSVKFTPQNNWREKEKIWIDNYIAPGKWAVLEKNSTWIPADENLYDTEPVLRRFGLSVAAESTGNYVIVGSGSQKVFVYKKNADGSYVRTNIITNYYSGNVNFGAQVGYLNSILVVGDLGYDNKGALIIYEKDATDNFNPIQFISPGIVDNQFFGNSFVLSNNFLIVGSSGINTVYIYKKQPQPEYTVDVPTPTQTFTLPFSISSDDSIILVSDNGRIISPSTYIITGSTIQFNLRPTASYKIYQRSFYYRLVQTIVQTKFSLPDDLFGSSVDINKSESMIYVGAPLANVYDIKKQKYIANSGQVFVYHLYKGKFQFLQRIKPAITEKNGRFGTSVKINSKNTVLFVGSAGVSFPSTYRSGQVYRFDNLGQILGTATTKRFNGSLTAPGSIIINGYTVTVSGNISDIKDQIDAVDIPYISTKIVGQILTIRSSSLIELDKLTILSGDGTAFEELGINFLTETQIIPNPIDRNLSRFGTELDLSDNNNQLFVSSPHATSIIKTIFDDDTCYFDSTATIFQDQQVDSGSVCVFEFIKPMVPTRRNLGSYIFGQQLETPQLSGGDLFGSSLSVVGNKIFVGAPGDDIVYGTDNRGRVFEFTNLGNDTLWKQVKSSQSLVDIDRINKTFLYNKQTNLIITELDIIDPLKGRILGSARQYIDYIESQDPAAYNRSSAVDTIGLARIDEYDHWDDSYVGKYWLDTSQLRFIDYEQQDLLYRKNNWNRLFPGSEVRVYQWVESNVLPSVYSKFYSGTPLYINDESYSISYFVDKNSGATTTKYYFWVRNLETRPLTKEMSTDTIEEYIANPKLSGIPYIVFYSPKAFGLYNVSERIYSTDTSSNTILHIDYDLISTENLTHAEYELVQENNIISTPPVRVLSKLIDSLSGINAIGDLVPDPLLKISERYGLNLRPRQTLIANRLAALEVLITQANLILAHLFTATRIINTDFFYENNKHSSTEFWRYATWSIEGFDPTTPTQYTVSKLSDLKKTNFAVGSLVKVTNDGGLYTIVKITETGFDLQAQEQGTIELLPTIYESTARIQAVRKLLRSLFYQLLIDDYTIYANKLFFVIVRYVLREQKFSDWMFKTSFITINHTVTQFEQYPNYQVDNTTYLIDYITEAKPYRTKIREYRPRYTGTTSAELFATDFDLPAYYDTDSKLFRSPSGEQSEDILLWTGQSKYQDWYANYKLHLDSIRIGMSGSGYLTPPTITITGGGGTGASARAIINAGIITDVVVDNPGMGYTTTPTVTVTRVNNILRLNTFTVAVELAKKVAKASVDPILNAAFDIVNAGFRLGDLTNSGTIDSVDVGLVLRFSSLVGDDLIRVTDKLTKIQTYVESHNGTNSLVTDAVLYAGIINNTTRQFSINLLFDRVSYRATSTGKGFDEHLFDDDDFDNGDPIFKFQTALDRVRQYYTPQFGQSGLDYGQLFNGVNFPGYNIRGVDYNAGSGFASRSFNATPYDSTGDQSNEVDMVLASAYQDLLLGTRAEDITFDGGEFVGPAHSHAPEELVPGIVFDTLEIRVFHKFTGSATPNVSFRMFKDLMDQYSYYRMSNLNSSTLSQPLLITDTEIAVVSAAVFDEPNPNGAVPGVVFISGERITYYERDIATNRLKRIRRGTAGTGAETSYAAGTAVVGSGYSQLIEYNAHTTVWYDPAVGLSGSTSKIANFLKDRPPVSVT